MTNTTKPALSAAPVAQEPGLNWQISQEARDQIAEIERNIREASINARNIIAGSTNPPATPAGLGADEIVRVFARWKRSKNLHESLAAQNIEKELLALLSRGSGESVQK